MAGVPAGRLSIDIVAEVARLQADMDKVRKLVRDASGDIATSARAANDNLGRIGEGMARSTRTVAASAGQQRAAMQQLSYQIGDVAQQFALGVNPMVIFAQQGGQVVQALGMMQGEARGLIGFLGGPWGAVIMGGVTILGMMIPKLLETSDGMEKVKLSSNGLKDAQGYLGGVFDMTTGKMNVQTGAALALARAQIILAQATARKNLAEANRDITQSAEGSWQIYGGMGGGVGVGKIRGIEGQVASQFRNGVITADQAIDKLRGLAAAGRITDDTLTKLSASIANNAVETNNLKIMDDAYASLLTGKVAPGLRVATTAHAGHKEGLSAAEKAAREFLRALQDLNIEISRSMGEGGSMNKWARDLLGKLQGEIGPNAMREDLARQTDERTRAFREAAEANAEWNAQLDETIARLNRIGGLGSTIAGWAGVLRGDFSGLPGATGVALETVWGLSAGTMFDKNSKTDVAVTLGDRIERIFDGPNSKFGKTMGQLLDGAGTGIAISSAVFGQNNQAAQIGGALGGAAGQAIGTAIGGALGAAVPVIGSLLGGLVGSIFGKKPKGGGTVSNTGVNTWANDGGMKAGLDSFGLGIQQSVSKIAEQLGGTVGNYSVGIGGYKGGYYQVSRNANDPYLGQSNYNKKSGAAVYDGLDATAALRAAISVAIEQGAIQGVRAGTQTLLKAGTDIEAQLAKALKFQGVFDDLKQATDPLGYAMDQLTKKFTDLRAIFKEAGATAADYADLEKLLAIQRQQAADQARSDAVSKLSDALNLQIRMLELAGKSEDALAASRLLEVAGMKASLQPLQALVYQMEDWRATIDKFGPLADDLKKFKAELLGGDSTNSYGFLAAQFRAAAAAAAGGDATAMGNLRGYGTDYLAAAKDNAATGLDYQRAVSEVLAGVNSGIFAAEATVDYAKVQMEAALRQVDVLADMNKNLSELAAQALAENTAARKLIDQLVNDGFQVTIPVKVV